MAFKKMEEALKQAHDKFVMLMTPTNSDIFVPIVREKGVITLADYKKFISSFNSYDLRYIQEFADEELLWHMLREYSKQTRHAGPYDLGNTYDEVIVSVLVPKLLKKHDDEKKEVH